MGFGAFSKVKSATHSLTGQKVAIKIMNRHKMKDMEEKGNLVLPGNKSSFLQKLVAA